MAVTRHSRILEFQVKVITNKYNYKFSSLVAQATFQVSKGVCDQLLLHWITHTVNISSFQKILLYSADLISHRTEVIFFPSRYLLSASPVWLRALWFFFLKWLFFYFSLFRQHLSFKIQLKIIWFLLCKIFPDPYAQKWVFITWFSQFFSLALTFTLYILHYRYWCMSYLSTWVCAL